MTKRLLFGFLPFFGLLLGGVADGAIAAEEVSAPSEIYQSLLIEEAKAAGPKRYQYAVDQGAEMRPTPDGRSFYILWFPEAIREESRRPLIVVLHGLKGWAFDGFHYWHPRVEGRDIGILALQWRFGQEDDSRSVYSAREAYEVIESVLKEEAIEHDTALLHGFGWASVKSYEMAFWDRRKANDYIILVLADSGRMPVDFPPQSEEPIDPYKSGCFHSVNWAILCREIGENPELDGCPAMRFSRDRVLGHGGLVELFIEDDSTAEEDLLLSPGSAGAVLDLFSELLAAS